VLILIRKARRRLLYNELLSQAALALCTACAALILLLILGTQILNWYWAALIPAAAVVLAAYRVRRRRPALYATAQLVDRRLDLADSLSTAVFFDENNGPAAAAEVRQLQRQQAERVAGGVDLRLAVPYTMPRTAYPAAALILVAASLVGVRYGLTRRLDLGQPMARILQQSLGLETPETARNAPRKDFNSKGSTPEDGDSPLAQDRQPDAPDAQPGDPLEENNEAKDQDSKGKQASKDSKDGANPDGQGDDRKQGDQRAADNQNSDSKNGDKEGQDQSGGQEQSGNSNSSSLLNKMKEAMQNLLSSMKQQPNGSQQQQQQQNNSAQAGKQKGQQNGGKAPKGEKQSGQSGGEEQDPDLNSESQQAENSPGQGSDAQPANKQPGGGVGSRDGGKDVKQAEQLAAMGKISQIIGKRQQNLSGEATVEVQSTVQQLKTAYSDRTAQHTDSGGEIGRDEIPAAFESYVQQYFEQVHKQPAPKK
jgi:hypothetical protein